VFSNRLTRIIALLAGVAGATLTLFLSWAHFAGTLGSICSEAGGCGNVLTSRYAVFLGLPTALYGFIFYFTVSLLLVSFPFLKEEVQDDALSKLVGLTGAAFLVSLFLTGYSFVSLNALCGYCLGSTGLVTVLFGVTSFWKIRSVRMNHQSSYANMAWKGGAIGLAVLLVAVGGLYFQANAGETVGSPGEKRALVAEHRAIGNPDAPIRVVEFFDLACPHCQNFALNTFPKIRENYIANGDVVWVFRDFPIGRSHPNSPRAHAILSQVPFIQYLNAKKKIMRDADQWTAASNGNPDEYFDFFAKRYGLKLSSNITEKLTQQIMNRRDVGADIGIRSTPSFMVNGEVHQGALPHRRWERIFDTILNEQ